MDFRFSRVLFRAVLVWGAVAWVQTACTSGSDGSSTDRPETGDEAGSGGEAPGSDAQAGAPSSGGGDSSSSGGAADDRPCVPPDDVKGDCQRTTCAADGTLKTAPDDFDKPDDLNDCTLDECKNGKPGHSPASPETRCGTSGKLKCDGAGKCANCIAAADCGESNPCVSFECSEGTCQTNYVPKTEGKLTQSTGDCKKNVCNGEGSPIAIPDTTDLPVTQVAGDCKRNGCSAEGSPIAIPDTSDLPATQSAGDCKKNGCSAAGSPIAIPDTSDLPVDDNPCSNDQCSAAGVPQHPPVSANTACGTNLACDGQGHCVCVDPHACDGKCGSITDACGHAVDCGNPCEDYDTCGGGGVAHVCGCTPHTPDCGFTKCGGLYPNGCGQDVVCTHYDSCTGGSCGNCQGYCGGDNTCVCDAPPCS